MCLAITQQAHSKAHQVHHLLQSKINQALIFHTLCIAMAICLQGTHLHYLSPITIQTPNFASPIPGRSISFIYNRWIKTSHSLSARCSIRASLVSADVVTEQTHKPTLRELCQGHVPEHVLRRCFYLILLLIEIDDICLISVLQNNCLYLS